MTKNNICTHTTDHIGFELSKKKQSFTLFWKTQKKKINVKTEDKIRKKINKRNN